MMPSVTGGCVPRHRSCQLRGQRSVCWAGRCDGGVSRWWLLTLAALCALLLAARRALYTGRRVLCVRRHGQAGRNGVGWSGRCGRRPASPRSRRVRQWDSGPPAAPAPARGASAARPAQWQRAASLPVARATVCCCAGHRLPLRLTPLLLPALLGPPLVDGRPTLNTDRRRHEPYDSVCRAARGMGAAWEPLLHAPAAVAGACCVSTGRRGGGATRRRHPP